MVSKIYKDFKKEVQGKYVRQKRLPIPNKFLLKVKKTVFPSTNKLSHHMTFLECSS